MHPAHVYNDTRMICHEADRRSCFAQHTSFYIDMLYSTKTHNIYVCADVQMLSRSAESFVRQ
ncbi:hypothetical protein ALC57_11338 [Trachymyrmex cornetzi]|uniref:Uncharacterized protein n=1 Tax=Trachymyrmex cornetzi TaxID=471704 RepID=A0A195DUB0_9HYME|nr:hypothetical protein ALC57_11338 [Trachymyrmex cornetzi]